MTEDRLAEPGPGKKLRDAREQQSLSLEQVAEALHLDEAVIVALENERFETFGAPVYVRGHLKAYALLLGLSPGAIANQYQEASPKPVAAPALRQPRVASFTGNPVLWAGGALALLLGVFLGVYVLLGDDEPGVKVVAEDSVGAPAVGMPVQTAQPAAVVQSPPVVKEVPASDSNRAVPAVETMMETPVLTAPIKAADSTSPASAADTRAARPVATMRLGLNFSQESWVEISDANRRLLFGLQRQGNSREVTGEPPFALLIGNARGVELTINDEPFDVPASRVRGKVARFEITGEDLE